MTAVSRQIPVLMTRDEFAAWDAPGPQRWQLIDGQAVAMAPASDPHGSIQAELSRLIGNCLVEAGSPCRVVTTPGVVPRIRSDMNFRVPDLGVTCQPPVATGSYVDEPVLLVEIMSPSNKAETWANVWTYCSIPSVTEILLVHSTRIEAELLRRGPDGSWPPEPLLHGPDAVVTLESIVLSVPLMAFYRTTALSQ